MKNQQEILSNRFISINKKLNLILLVLIIVNTVCLYYINLSKVLKFNFKNLFFQCNIIKSQMNKQILDKCLGINTDNRSIAQAVANTILLFNENKD